MEQWVDANWRYLSGEMARVLGALERAASHQPPTLSPPTPIPVELIERAPAITTIGRSFGLSAFERDLVLACAAAELEPDFAKRTGFPKPLMRLALNALPNGEPTVLSFERPLRKFGIVAPLDGLPLFGAPLSLDEAVLQFLMGSDGLDGRLATILDELVPTAAGDEITRQIVEKFRRSPTDLTVNIVGSSSEERQSIATAASQQLGLRTFRLKVFDIPSDSLGRVSFRQRWERIRKMSPFALLVELERETALELTRAASTLVAELGGLSFVSSHQPVAISKSCSVGLEVPALSRSVRLDRLKRAVGPHDSELHPTLEQITTQFMLSGDKLDRACLAIEGGHGSKAERLWNACRIEARPHLDDIARRIEPHAGWDDLILPEVTRVQLRELASHIRNRTTVLESWGFGGRIRRGLGTGALFAGASGTGKTLAAEVLARDARLDLYHLDLSQLVNKYVGETEKNLRRVFDAAEDSGAILLFDEADALFGKRSEVEKGTDRYANIEISYLLQRMESYRGVAILTTNQRKAIDSAFVRRLRFIVNFPFPDTAERLEIWRQAFPIDAPTSRIDPNKLAKLQLPGGNIRSIALNAAFLAAESGESISMSHLLHASRAEYQKIDRPFPELDAQSW